MSKNKTEDEDDTMYLGSGSNFDPGKDLEIRYVDPENEKVLYRDLCTESYMNDMKNSGMQFEAIRELNEKAE